MKEMYFDSALNMLSSDKELLNKEKYICSKGEPEKLIVVSATQELYQDHTFIATQFKPFVNGKEIRSKEFEHGKFLRYHKRNGKNTTDDGDAHWRSMKEEIYQKGKFHRDILIFDSKKEYEKYKDKIERKDDKNKEEEIIEEEDFFKNEKEQQKITEKLKNEPIIVSDDEIENVPILPVIKIGFERHLEKIENLTEKKNNLNKKIAGNYHKIDKLELQIERYNANKELLRSLPVIPTAYFISLMDRRIEQNQDIIANLKSKIAIRTEKVEKVNEKIGYHQAKAMKLSNLSKLIKSLFIKNNEERKAVFKTALDQMNTASAEIISYKIRKNEYKLKALCDIYQNASEFDKFKIHDKIDKFKSKKEKLEDALNKINRISKADISDKCMETIENTCKDELKKVENTVADVDKISNEINEVCNNVIIISENEFKKIGDKVESVKSEFMYKEISNEDFEVCMNELADICLAKNTEECTILKYKAEDAGKVEEIIDAVTQKQMTR